MNEKEERTRDNKIIAGIFMQAVGLVICPADFIPLSTIGFILIGGGFAVLVQGITT